jgi:hypothetical protein
MLGVHNCGYIKHYEKICSVCGGHFISMNFPPRNWEGYYASSSKMGVKLCLRIGVRTLPFIHLEIDIDLVRDHFCLANYDS